MLSTLTWVAQQQASGGMSRVFIPVAVLLAVVIVGSLVILAVRRSVRSDGPSNAPGFSLQDLRDLHRAGQMNDDEFERARDAMIRGLKQAGTGATDAVEDAPPKDLA